MMESRRWLAVPMTILLFHSNGVWAEDSQLTADALEAPFIEFLETELGSELPKNGSVVDYLTALYHFAKAGKEGLFDEDIFPAIVAVGKPEIDVEQGERALFGWLFSMALAEICTKKYSELYRIGFLLAGDEQPVLTVDMKSNPYISRMIASVLYVRFRRFADDYLQKAKEELTALNDENPLGCLKELIEDALPTNKAEGVAMLPDGTLFMPPAPLNTQDNPQFSYDEEIMAYVEQNYTLDSTCVEYERAIQSVEDNNYYMAYQKVIYEKAGVPISTKMERLLDLVLKFGSWATHTMKDGYCEQTGEYLEGYSENGAERTDAEYRKRPYDYYESSPLIAWNEYVGLCYPSYTEENYPIDYLIEYGKTSSSYPSGHSAREWNLALVLVNAMPDLYRNIIRRAFRFAQNRTISRYHWYSDVLIGCVMGSTVIPWLYNYSEYRELLKKAQKKYDSSIVDDAYIKEVVNFIMGKRTDGFDENKADVNGDGCVNAADLVLLLKIKQ